MELSTRGTIHSVRIKKRALKLKQFIGIILALIGAFFAALEGSLIKLAPRYPVWKITFYRMAPQAVIFIIIYSVRKKEFFANKSILLRSGWKLALRGTFGVMTIYAVMFSLENIPIGEAQSLHYTQPVFVTILGWILLKEHVKVVTIAWLLVILTGSVFIARWGGWEFANRSNFISTAPNSSSNRVQTNLKYRKRIISTVF